MRKHLKPNPGLVHHSCVNAVCDLLEKFDGEKRGYTFEMENKQESKCKYSFHVWRSLNSIIFL